MTIYWARALNGIPVGDRSGLVWESMHGVHLGPCSAISFLQTDARALESYIGDGCGV